MAATSYELKFSDPTKQPDFITVLGISEGTGKNNYDTSLDLVGPGYVAYGQSVQQNFLKLLENFSSPYAPLNGIEGQLWYDTSNPDRKVLRINNGTITNNRWPSANGIYQQSNDPAYEYLGNIKEGDIWVDTSVNQLKIRYSNNWTLVGPQAAASGSRTGSEATTVESNTGTTYPVILNWANGKVVEIISQNSFVPRTVINGFTSVQAGTTLRAGTKYNGTSEKAESLSLPSGAIIRSNEVLRNRVSGSQQIHTGTFVVESAEGLYVKNASFNQQIRVYNTGSGAYIDYSDTTKSFKIGVGNDAFVQFNPIYNSVGINKAPTSVSPAFDVNGSAAFSGSVAVNSTATTSLTVAGGATISKNLLVSGTVRVIGTSTFNKPLVITLTPGFGSAISVNTSTYDIGSSATPFRTVYAKQLGDSANTASTNVYGTFHGLIASDARLSSRNFKIQGQVTATSVSWNATADAVFNTTLTASAIDNQTSLASANSTSTLLISGGNSIYKITKGDLLSDLYSALLTTGMIIPYGGTTAPVNFLLCNGSTYSQGTYPALFAVIGTTYGTGAPGTFKVPNMTGVTNAVGSIPVNYIIKT